MLSIKAIFIITYITLNSAQSYPKQSTNNKMQSRHLYISQHVNNLFWRRVVQQVEMPYSNLYQIYWGSTTTLFRHLGRVGARVGTIIKFTINTVEVIKELGLKKLKFV